MRLIHLNTIEKRVIFVVVTALITLCALFYILFRITTLNTFLDREIQNYESKSAIAGIMLQSSLESLPAITRDWSSWDLTYDFVLGTYAEYPDTTLTEYPFQLHKLDICVILDLDGNILMEHYYDFNNNAAYTPVDDLHETYRRLGVLTSKTMDTFSEPNVSETMQFGIAGYAYCGQNWYYFSSYPVLPSNEDKPSVGTFIFGRMIDSKEIERIIGGKSDLRFNLIPVFSENYIELQKQISLSPGQSTMVLPDVKMDRVNAYAFMKDVFGENDLILNLYGDMGIYREGASLLRIVFFAVVCVVMIILALIIFLLRKIVLSPLTSLGNDVKQITEDVEQINAGYPSDEFGMLAGKINEMLARLGTSRKILKESNRQLEIYKQSILSAKDSIIVFDRDGVIEYVNPAFSKDMSYRDDEIEYKQLDVHRVLFNMTQEQDVKKIMDILESGESYSGELLVLKNDETETIYDITAAPIHDENQMVRYITVIMRNIEEKKKYEDLLERQANYDMLTNLPNRWSFTHRLDAAIDTAKAEGHQSAMFFLDLNNFKIINDTLGHGAGDTLLQKVAERLTESFPCFDCIARMGGDEFAIIVANFKDITVMDRYAHDILTVFEMPFNIKDREFIVTTSLGSSVFPSDGPDAETLIRNADTAMYKAKSTMKNCYQPFSDELHALIQQRMTMEYSMRVALEKEEFVPYFQPKIYTSRNQVFGSEALIRWHSPNGLVMPNQFIPLAEDTGLIVPMTRWMLKEVCKRNYELIQNGTENTVAINIPSQVLLHKDFFEMIDEAFVCSGMPPQYLDIEITEGTLLIDSDATLKVLKNLHAKGIEISLDDFGTGYSSLSYLKKYPITRIKIDRSFVMETPNDIDSVTIIKAIIAMTKGLNLKTTAEGIETVEQLKLLHSLGCDEGQGYLISKPLPFDRYKMFLEEWKKSH